MTYAPITRNGVDQAEPLDFPTKRLTISTTVTYRGRAFTVSAEGYTVDRLCDMLDEKFGAPSAQPNGSDTVVPSCPAHHKPMREGKGGYYCPSKVGDGWCKERA